LNTSRIIILSAALLFVSGCYYPRRIAQLEQELDEAKALLKGSDIKYNKMESGCKARITALEGENRKLKDNQAEFENKLKAKDSENKAAQNELTAARLKHKADLAHRDEKIDGLAADLAHRDAKIDGLVRENAELKKSKEN